MQILITGASTGIGEACARWFDARGHRVFAGVRREADAEKLRAGSSDRMTPVTIDVADASSIRASLDTIAASLSGAGLDGLVNNAGIAVPGPLEYLPLDAIRQQLEINVVGQIGVTQAFLPLIRRGRGRIVFMGSIGGLVCTPFLGPYCASKFALEAIADALRIEVQPWGIHVTIVEPGSIATPIWNKPGVPFDRARIGDVERDYGAALDAFRAAVAAAGARGLPADRVAAVVDHALTARSPRTRYVIGPDARFQRALRSLVPDRLRDLVLTRILKLPPRGAATHRPIPH
jgi:NAD(P)-dependent dehydrogenase (short-subunit alcohol dehydrogenase family)